MVRIGIIGAAGLSGRELLYLLESHDEASVELLTSSKYQGKKVNDVFPELTGYNQVFQPNDIDVTGCDLVFLAIPNQASLERVPNLLEQGVRVIDLSGAFRLRDKEVFSKFYKLSHSAPELLEEPYSDYRNILKAKLPQQDWLQIQDVMLQVPCWGFCRWESYLGN